MFATPNVSGIKLILITKIQSFLMLAVTSSQSMVLKVFYVYRY